MKILFLETVQDHGGARKSTLELAKRLQNFGHILEIVDFYGNNSEFVNDVREKGLKLRILKPRKTPFIIRSKNYLLKILKTFLFVFEFFDLKKRLKVVIASFEPDFILTNNTKTLSIVPSNVNYKRVFFARGWFLPSQISFRDKFVIKQKSDLIFAVSQATRHALYSGNIASLEQIFVVPNNIDLDSAFFQLSERPFQNDEITIVHCGGFIPDKGHHISIEVSKKLKQKGIKHKIILIGKVYSDEGSGDYLESLYTLRDSYNLERIVSFVKNQNDVLSYIKNADILIHPSSTEGLPRVLMEALALRTVVIANPVGGVTDYILDGFTGFIADYNNVDSFVEKIKICIADRNSSILIAENGFNLVRSCYGNGSQSKIVNQILSNSSSR